MVVLLFAGLLANVNAPRRLQSFNAAVQAEAAALSSVLSTVIVVFGALGTIAGWMLSELSTMTSLTPFSFFGRVNTATGALSTSKAVLARSPSLEILNVCSLGEMVRTISSLGSLPPINIRSSVSRYARFVRSNAFADAELPAPKLLTVILFGLAQPGDVPGRQLGTDSTSWLLAWGLSLPLVRSAASSRLKGRLSSFEFRTR